MTQRTLYSGLDLYDWRGSGPSGRTKVSDVDKWQQNQDDIRHLPGAFPVQSVVITDGQITPTAAALTVDTEGGAPADDLTAIAPGDLHAGMLLALCSVDEGRKVTIKSSAGASGIQTLDGKDVVLGTKYAVMLRLVSTESLTLWREEPGPLRLQLTVSTPDMLGGVKVQTGDDDGLEMIGDKLRVRNANSTQRGSVLASETAQAGAVPVGGDNGWLDDSWVAATLLNTRVVITESNASWTPPVTGWARVTVIGGGGGGAGGSGNDEHGVGGGGGGSGDNVIDYVYLSGQAEIIIGAGGNGGSINNVGASGGKSKFTLGSKSLEAEGGKGGGATVYIPFTIAAPGTSGGSGGFNGQTGCIDALPGKSGNTAVGGNGGGPAAGYSGTRSGSVVLISYPATGYGSGGAGGTGSKDYSASTNRKPGSNGAAGAVIIEYYDPEKEVV